MTKQTERARERLRISEGSEMQGKTRRCRPPTPLGQLWQWDRISLWWWHREIKSSKIYQKLSLSDFFPDPDALSGCCHTVPMWALLPPFLTLSLFWFLLLPPSVLALSHENFCHSHFCFTLSTLLLSIWLWSAHVIECQLGSPSEMVNQLVDNALTHQRSLYKSDTLQKKGEKKKQNWPIQIV